MSIQLPKNIAYKLISVDIFDTLLFRAVAMPDDLFEIVWNEAQRRELAQVELSCKEYRKLRIEMERRVRENAQNREVTLDEIYAGFPPYLVSNLQELKKIELECEKKYCYQNSVVWSWLKEAYANGSRIVLVSDMYLSRTDIEEILISNDIELKYLDRIIVSNEYQCNKQNGDLFQILMKYYPDVLPSEMLHIGDNRNSDYNQPLRCGMNAFHYDVIPEQSYSIFHYEKIRHDVPLPELLSLRKLVYSLNPYMGVEGMAYELGSVIVGPVLSLFTTWIYQRMEKLKLSRIYPFMREGYLLGKLLERECEEQHRKFEIHPIYVSRKVTYVPSITKINREEIENMIGARNLTIGESIKLVGIELSKFEEIDMYYDVLYKNSHKIPFKNSTLKEYVICRLLEADNRNRISNYILEERKKLIDYLKQEIGDFNEIATVDIGFFGRIQMWLEKCLRIEEIPYKIKHFLAIGITGDKVYDGMNFEGMFGTYSENQDLIQTIHRTTDVIEKLISVTEGSTIGYERTEGKIIPILDMAVSQKCLTEIVFQGIFDFQEKWFDFRRQKPDIANESLRKKRELLKILHRLIDMPRKEEAQFLADFEADTNFGTTYRKGIITKEHLALAKEKGLDFVDRCNISYTYEDSNITWPKGTITLMDEFYYVRKALKNGSKNEIMKSMQEVVEKVEQDGIQKVALYGAGENGRQFYFICQMYHIDIACFIDRKESLWGSKKEGIEVIGIKEAVQRGYDAYIVTSLFSINEITDVIQQHYQGLERKPRIYSV